MLRWPGAAWAAQVTARLDSDIIYFGTRTLLVVQVSDAANDEWPVVAQVEGLEIARYGAPSLIHNLISGSIRRTYRFWVQPLRPGEFIIPSVSVGSGTEAVVRGPFKLQVLEAALKFLSAGAEPDEIRVGERAMLTIRYQGIRPGKSLELPAIDGLTLQAVGGPRVELSQPEGMPVSIYQVTARAAKLGNYEIKGISLDKVAAGPMKLKVSPFVVAGIQVGESSLVVGGKTFVNLAIRGLPASAGIKLVAPPGLHIQASPQSRQGRAPMGTSIFSFEVTATEPGAPSITALQLADGTVVPLASPITFLVRSSGEGGILACRGAARSSESVVGAPFIVDYEVFFRGDIRAAGIDLEQAEFTNRPYVRVEPVNDISYSGWSGQPIEVGMSGNSHAVMLLGSGELNGSKEQLLRFALKITPLAVGELELKGVRVIIRLQVKEERRTGGVFLSTTRTQDYEQVIDLPPHQVVDPPGKNPPPGYRGAVGAGLTYSASLDRTTATAMSPLTLTLTITGEGVGPQFKPPLLTAIPELVRDFDVSSTIGGGEVQGDTITFTQVVRPRSEKVRELPALPLVYYDYEQKDYKTVYSLPVAINVTPGHLVGASAMQTRSGPQATLPAGGESARADEEEVISLGANYATLGELEGGPPLSAGGVVAMLLSGPVLILGTWAGLRWRERRRPVASLQRQRRELAAALERVGENGNFHAQLAELVQAYLRLTFDLPPGEVSPEMLGAAMDQRSVEGKLRQQVEELLARCDVGRFAAADVAEEERRMLVTQAREVFKKLM